MLAVSLSPLRRSNKDDDQSHGEMAENNFFSSIGGAEQDFAELSEGNLLESINFDDLFSGINDIDGDVLPDLEMDHELFSAEFSLSGGGGEESDELASSVVTVVNSKPDGISCGGGNNNSDGSKPDEGNKSSAASSSSDSGDNSGGSSSKGEEIVSKRDESVVVNPLPNNINKESEKGRKSSSKNHPQGKKKVKKVDWTPELHRRFVQAVEQLGVDKAVPSRILEVMGIDCLTRHNIASHLQKYRSHRKHLLAREAEAASWSQRRQMLVAAAGNGGGGGGKRDLSPWVAPTIGFPPMTPPMPTHFRPLHVWGHPTMDQSLMHIWPKPSPPPTWAAPPSQSQPQPPPPNSDPSYWHQRAPSTLTPGAPCFPQPPLTMTRFGSPTTVPGVPPPHAMYKLDPGIAVPPRQPGPRPLFDFHPTKHPNMFSRAQKKRELWSKESVDAVIGDVLSKPWLPLPLGLKAPAIESVMGELQRQGIPKVPPSCA